MNDIKRMVEEQDFPDWLGATADMEWEELTDEQRTFFENYRAYLDEEMKDFAVKPRDPDDFSRKMAVQLAETQKEATAKLHQETIHFMSYDKHGSKGEGVYCTCGKYKLHNRGKVLARWADKHFEKYNHYWRRT